MQIDTNEPPTDRELDDPPSAVIRVGAAETSLREAFEEVIARMRELEAVGVAIARALDELGR